MKSPFLILGIPVFVFLTLSFTLDLGALLPGYSDYDLTPYLSARSLFSDRDLACSTEDTDRFFHEQLWQANHFRLTRKSILTSSGEPEQYTVFYDPEIYVFFLAPFAGLFGFKGLFLFQALLMAAVYLLGCVYYRKPGESAAQPAANSLLYYTLVPLPLLFLTPSSHLFVFAAVSASLFFALRERPVFSAATLALACSSVPWAALMAVLPVVRWQETRKFREAAMFVSALAAGLLVVWGAERLMYPSKAGSEIREVIQPPAASVDELWETFPQPEQQPYFQAPDWQRLGDGLFGRTSGFLVYGVAAASLLLSGIWLWRDPLIRNGLLLSVLYWILFTFTSPVSWRISGPAADSWILPAALPFFLLPLIRPRKVAAIIIVLSLFILGPLLMNPVGAHINRMFYLQAFPFRYFPAELSLLGRSGLQGNGAFRLRLPGKEFYFLNDHFYIEKDFFWVRGDSEAEFILELDDREPGKRILIQNGPMDNRIQVFLQGKLLDLRMVPTSESILDLDRYLGRAKQFKGRFYLHGKIRSGSGYIPKLLSRDSLDYRYLGCRVEFVSQE